jgi:glycosyltransferase involved in cell wall biosynthesis
MRELSGARVAILVQNLPVPFDRRVWQEATALHRAGTAVTVICPSDDRHPAGRFDLDGVVVHRYRAPTEARGALGYLNEYTTSIRRMRAAFKAERARGRFDVVHFCNPPDLLFMVAAEAKRHDGSTLVFDQHDLGPELVRAKHMPLSFLLVRIAEYFERRTYRWADRVIATNESYKAIAQRRGNFAADGVTVIRSAPPSDWSAYDAKSRDWHRGSEFLIGYVGVMGKQEGIEYLIDAMDELVNQRGLDVGLALVGGGPEREALEKNVAQRGLSNCIRFYGRVPDEQLQSILSDADVCVNPDEVNEMNDLSTMNKIVEYMALGRPIVQFDVTEGRFSAREASLYARPNDARDLADKLAQLLSDPVRRAEMSAFGRRRFLDELCWDIQAEKLVAFYQSLIRPPAASARLGR